MARTLRGSESKRIGRASPPLMLVLALAIASLVAAAPANAATRDIRVHFTNSSDEVLTRASGTLDAGCWGVEPPLKIEIDQTVDIASESCGVATGTEFTVTYWVGSSGAQMTMHYNNPFGGTDEFDENAPEGYAFETSGVIEDRTTKFKCDSPCDGIPLAWKQNGVTIDPGGGNPPQFVDLPAMGVALDRPNVLVHLDWMADATPRNQQLRQVAIDAVIDAFDKDPVTHRGATRPGITLIVDAGSNSTLRPGGPTWGLLSQAQLDPVDAIPPHRESRRRLPGGELLHAAEQQLRPHGAAADLPLRGRGRVDVPGHTAHASRRRQHVRTGPGEQAWLHGDAGRLDGRCRAARPSRRGRSCTSSGTCSASTTAAATVAATPSTGSRTTRRS